MKSGSEIWSGKKEFQGICYAIYKGIIYKAREYIDLKDGRGLFIEYWSNGKKHGEYYFKWPAKEYWPYNIEGEYKLWNENGKLFNFLYLIDKNDSKYKDAEKNICIDDSICLNLIKHPEYIEEYNLDIRF